MSPTRRVLLFGATLLLAVGLTVPAAHAASRSDFECTSDSTQPMQLPAGSGATGLYSLPARRPKALIAFAHGYQQTAAGAWKTHLVEAAQHGYAAFAPDYPGWRVNEGAAELISASKFFLSQCRSIHEVVMFGVSMGGNSSGIAVAAGQRKPQGGPLFDYWIDVEGVSNLLEEYTLATAAQGASATAASAVSDIDAECGGTPADNPGCYQELTLTTRPQDIAASGVKAVAMVHAVEDGEVPNDQTRQLSTELRALGLTTDVYNVLRRNAGETGSETTITSDAGSAIAAQDPFAGHTWEGTSDTAVMGTSLTLLWDLLNGTYAPATQEHVVDNQSVGISPPPNG
jgi:hypothetical protein